MRNGKRSCRFLQKQNRNPFKAMGLMSVIVSQLAGATVVGAFGGMWLDDQVHTKPLFLVIGLLLGLAAGVYSTIRLINRYLGDEE
jgi:ATP synthase protein I